jgi:hypothetical protein
MTANPQYNRESCYFCHEPDTHLLEVHHIVPQRFDGSDDPVNLVCVCPTCHERLERLYDGRFFDALGIETESDDDNDDDSGDTDVSRPRLVKRYDDGSYVSSKSLIADLETGYDEGAPIETVTSRLVEEFDVDRSEARAEIEGLRRQGDVYEPTTDHLRTV